MPIPTPTPAGVRFEPADCPFGAFTGVECGTLTVPEDRSQPDGSQVQLAVAIIRSSNSNPAPDPVLLLYGGPGSQIVEYGPGATRIFKGILTNRDVIEFEPRGVGLSSPSLNCPEVEDQVFQDAPQNLNQQESQQHSLQAYQACHDRLVDEGINLSAYTSAASAADVNDLRLALGYTEWNIVGDSYSARLALTVMRDFPEGVRSVVLDSVYPPQASMDTETAANAERALNLLFERCASDDACNTAYPDLETVFNDAVAQLDTYPISFDLVSQLTQKKVTVLINGDRMINLIIYFLSYSEMLPYIPMWIYEFDYGNAASDYMLSGYMYFFSFSNEISSEGKALSVQCSEETSFSSTEAIEAANAAVLLPRLAEAVNQGWTFAMCSVWNVEPAAEIENKPVVSDIPTLLLAGDNDPGSPPAWSISTAENLSHSYSFEFPWASHGLIYGGTPAADCARSMMSAFIADPATTPDSTCIDSLKVTFVTE
jgi:pimeloyl-ACP methyl ester carboxylesterase